MALSKNKGGVQSTESKAKMSGVGGMALTNLLNKAQDVALKEQLKNEYTQSATTSSGQAVFNAFKRKKDRTFEDLVFAKKIAKEANAEERSIKSEQAFEQGLNINALSELAKNLYNISRTNKSFLNDLDEGEIDEEVKEQNKEEIDRTLYSPAAATIDRLSIQDYFPTIQEDIGVGTYSGRRLGSVTLFAAPGYVTPMGMIDARKRALAETVKNKQKALDKLLSISDAPEQFNEEYKARATEAIYGIAAKHGYNVNAIMRDKDAMAEIYRWQTTAEAFINVDDQIDALIDGHISKDGNIAYYIPEKALKWMQDFRSGKLDDLDDYLSGKKKVSEQLLKIRSFADGTRMVDRNMAAILANPRELPLNLKTGVEIDDNVLAEIEAARKEIAGGNGYDAYLNVVKKYYDIDVNGMVDSWMTNVGYEPDDEAREWVKQYALSRIPGPSLEQAIEYQANDDYKYYELRKKREWEQLDKTAFWEMTLKKFEAGAVNKAISDAQAAIDAETDPDKKASLLANAYNYLEEEFGTAFKVQKDQYDKNNVYGVITVDRNTQLAEASIKNERSKIYVAKRTWDRTKNKWVDSGQGEWVFFEDFKKTVNIQKSEGKVSGVKYNQYFPVQAGNDRSGNGNDDFNLDMAQTIEASSGGSLSLSAYEHRVQAGYVKDGVRYKVRTNNVRQYSEAQDQTLFVETIANPIIETDEIDDQGNRVVKQSRVNLRWESDLEETSDRQTLEVISSSKQQNKSGFSGNE